MRRLIQVFALLMGLNLLVSLIASCQAVRDFSLPASHILTYTLACVALIVILCIGVVRSQKNWKQGGLIILVPFIIMWTMACLELSRQVPPFILWWRHLDYLLTFLGQGL